MKDKILYKKVHNENNSNSAGQFIIPKKTTYVLLFVVIILTAFITYFAVESTQEQKVVKEGFPVSKTSGEISLLIRPPPQKGTSEGIVNLKIVPKGG